MHATEMDKVRHQGDFERRANLSLGFYPPNSYDVR
jgi:hypothetical protein